MNDYILKEQVDIKIGITCARLERETTDQEIYDKEYVCKRINGAQVVLPEVRKEEFNI